jgi:hypothetical protein
MSLGRKIPNNRLILTFLVLAAAGACSSEDSSSGAGEEGSETADIKTDSGISGPGAPDSLGGDKDGEEGQEGESDSGGGGGEGAGDADEGGGEASSDVAGACAPGDAEFECPCAENSDCESGFCLDTPTGSICTETCLDACKEGYSCKGVFNLIPDVVFVCVPDTTSLCRPCSSDLQCGDGKCIAVGSGNFCTRDCAEEACPTGYLCAENADVDTSGGFARQCIPETGSCDCTPQTAGATRVCSVENALGTCFGTETCDALQGWVGCTALEAKEEVCNGEDDDCNGIVDDGLPVGEPCQNEVDGVGACSGTRICLGVGGWLCSAPAPSDELCDFTDNDCDGEIDEDFTTAPGVYGLYEHCGTCNKSCGQGFPNATTKCDAAKQPPQCVVVGCDEGYFQLNEFQCVPFATALCQACQADTDCALPGSKCLALDDGSFCGKPCVTGGDCPVGYACLDAGGSLQCQPESGTCTCDGSNPNLKKGCSITYADPVNPGAPSYTCTGTQSCLPEGWGPCDLPVDLCDGLDNNCNGVADESFLSADGKYVTDAHCGQCNNSCQALNFENGKGACDAEQLIPQCELVCDSGFFDVDGNPANGCECGFSGSTDLPDGTDQNCDGVDGEITNAIFVAKNGFDTNLGTIESPLLTIAMALEMAQAQGKRDIYVATGVYQESFALRAGVGVYGGYASDFFTRDVTLYETVVVGLSPNEALPGAVNAIGLDGSLANPARFDGFTVFGYDNKLPGGNSYAIYIRNSGEQVRITNNTVYAGDGGAGLPGSAGQDGQDGVSGAGGLAATDSGSANCNTATNGGGGGTQQCGASNVNGGAGGNAICPDYDENGAQPASLPYLQTSKPAELGKAGSGPGAGSGGAAGFDFVVLFSQNQCNSCIIPPDNTSWNGSDGAPGQKGANGAPSSGCGSANGSVSGGQWVPGSGVSGTNGTAGGGGGGGGAGGGVEVESLCFSSGAQFSDRGGSGGGGGSGACPGTAGSAGGGGGGSFGIFVVWTVQATSVPLVEGNVVRRGFGGNGGNGGPGGVGGIGGDGGIGGKAGASTANAFCAPQGGYGGRGGDGGHGSGGGGGCGGASFGIFVSGQGALPLAGIKTTNDFVAGGGGGSGGLGGASLGNSGGAGSAGAAANLNF